MSAFAALIGAIAIAAEPPALPSSESFLAYNAALAVATSRGIPLVTFVHCEPRALYSAIVAHVRDGEDLPGIKGPCITVCVFGHGMRVSYQMPATATDGELLAKIGELKDSLRAPVVVGPGQADYLNRMIRGYDPSCRTG